MAYRSELYKSRYIQPLVFLKCNIFYYRYKIQVAFSFSPIIVQAQLATTAKTDAKCWFIPSFWNFVSASSSFQPSILPCVPAAISSAEDTNNLNLRWQLQGPCSTITWFKSLILTLQKEFFPATNILIWKRKFHQIHQCFSFTVKHHWFSSFWVL